MTINELKNGDIVLQRAGHLAMIVEKDGEKYMVYPDCGHEEIASCYRDDLTDFDEGPDFDIMQVYRAESGMISFLEYYEGTLIFERDQNWVRPNPFINSQLELTTL